MPGKMKIITLSALAESLSTLIYTTAAFDLKKTILETGFNTKESFLLPVSFVPKVAVWQIKHSAST